MWEEQNSNGSLYGGSFDVDDRGKIVEKLKWNFEKNEPKRGGRRLYGEPQLGMIY